MVAVIILGILLLVAVASLVAIPIANRRDAKAKEDYNARLETKRAYDHIEEPTPVATVPKGVFGVSFALLIIATLLTCVTTVSARAVGIATEFGRYSRTLDNGLQTKAPWESVEEFSTQVQYLDLDSTDGSDNKVKVAYKGGGDGWVSLTVRWRIEPKSAQFLWQKYKTFDQVTNQLVLSSSKDSVNAVVGLYAPNEARDGSRRKEIAQKIQQDLANDVKDDGIFIDSVSVKSVDLSEKTQASIEAIVQSNANIEKATAEQERARIDSETAKIRETSGALTGPALQRYCLEVTNAWDVKKNGPLPATWNCFAPSDASVLVNAK